ncbi:MAG: hypothetical protein AB1689_23760 [Thermodesulfobacteriota bacterium]
MKTLSWTPDEADAVLAAMRCVATLHGRRPLDAISRRMLEATRDHVLQSSGDVEALAELGPERLAERVRDDARRRLAVQFLVLMPYLPMQVDAAQVAVVDEFARALGVAPATLLDLHRVRDGRLKRLALDYGRRMLRAYVPDGGLVARVRFAVEIVRQYLGEKSVAERYRALALHPEGTLGREFYEFYRARGFPLPGEKGSLSEALVTHDLSHILAGFNTDMPGEMNVAGFEAGMRGDDFGWELLMEVILDFHCGLAFSTAGIVEPGRGNFRPEEVAKGFALGAGVTTDLLTGWDYWPDMGRGVDEVRARFNIRGVSGHHMPPPVVANAHPAADRTDARPA